MKLDIYLSKAMTDENTKLAMEAWLSKQKDKGKDTVATRYVEKKLKLEAGRK